MFAQESVMEIKKLKAEFEKLKYVEEKLEYLNFDEHLGCYVEKNNGMPVGLAAWVNGAFYGFEQAAKAQAVSEGRTDFEIINQTIELVDLLALSTNVFQRDPKSKVHPFESENPRVMEWWRTACQIQELLTNTDPDNCDFEEYKAMIEALEPAND